MLRNLAYIFLIIFFAVGAFAVYTFVRGAQTIDNAVVEPVGELMRSLVLPVTPEVLVNHVTIVHNINELARLETASYEVEKVVEVNANQGVISDELIFMGYGKIIAGVDFAKMREDDLQVVDPKTVWVHLPQAEIFDDLPILDTERSQVLDRDTGFVTRLLDREDDNLEKVARQAAEEAILEAVSGSDLLERADSSAEDYMRGLLQGLGFEEIVFMDETPPEPPPYEQPVPKGFAVTPVAP